VADGQVCAEIARPPHGPRSFAFRGEGHAAQHRAEGNLPALLALRQVEYAERAVLLEPPDVAPRGNGRVEHTGVAVAGDGADETRSMGGNSVITVRVKSQDLHRQRVVRRGALDRKRVV